MKKLLSQFKKKFSNYMIKRMIKRSGFDSDKMFNIELCRGAKRCSRNVIDVTEVNKLIQNTLKESRIAPRLHKKLVDEEYILPHHMFKLAISGCVNGCSKPQIKDFAIVGQLKPKIQEDLCIGCQRCLSTCQEDAIMLNDEEPDIDFDRCIFCGDCVKACPTEALTIKKVGYQIQVGGHLGRHPHLANIVTDLSDLEELMKILNKAIKVFVEEGEGQERLGVTLNRLEMDLD
ncbi:MULTISPECIES: 4Fe-4S binding protein [unclassified Candidatus Frackibacter]|uniref:4Fe-4S binding protein n=1 Tax=unclassified Candidatus Frackibacter TaxID=2648818 RepID=UPI00079AC800|nr:MULTISPECIES: 4Fe-4S binding protein [unclassified Candidatus Frackibacter]KXS45466.1 MAG: nitrite and sulfite reductase 4Fe-4S region [Candidatus Frackibacter sp. T328-2]SDC01231.1 4Fe-4S dicluster domain-containing protein [Candidatus Frackibacter sp. WG11]SEM32513.1 4Fe-4S dicluster domain-containing protein [Candidatus Frackibacter sp. WG12]SFL37455.1 4Fe-4S dicluster domain-containing protein [Candidatus Frackibacter sp. WG13]